MVMALWRGSLLAFVMCAPLLVALLRVDSRGAEAQAETVTIFAAASLKNAIDEIGAAYTRASGITVVGTYAASSALARQIEQGAPADAFISADLKWMDYLASKKLIDDGTRRNIASNRLVLIAPAVSGIELEIGPGFALADALGEERLAVGEVTAVPAGRYAKAALESLGVWTSVEAKLVQAENVRAALAYVALGEAPLGIVYRTDALAEPKVRIVGEFPESTHPPIAYPMAVTESAKASKAAHAFLDWLKTPAAAAIFQKLGFSFSK